VTQAAVPGVIVPTSKDIYNFNTTLNQPLFTGGKFIQWSFSQDRGGSFKREFGDGKPGFGPSREGGVLQKTPTPNKDMTEDRR